MKALLIYSGGMDSTVLLYDYYRSIELCIAFNYGSKHNDMEYKMAVLNCSKTAIPLIRIDLDFINKYFKSDLLQSGGEIPEGHYEDKSMKSTVVPFRNGIMLSIATGIAESNDLDTVLIANHAGDHAIYPDCRKTFINAIDQAAQFGTYNGVRIKSPYNDLSKRDIAVRGKQVGVDFSLTYSCYKGDELHCGVCGTCTERQEALNGFDPTSYSQMSLFK